MSRLCETCGERPSQWFTNDGYLCTPCKDELVQRNRVAEHVGLVESMAKALMAAHHHDWDMETVREASHICAQVALPVDDA